MSNKFESPNSMDATTLTTTPDSAKTQIMQSTGVDVRADIHPTAKIAADVVIGPWTVIGPYVEIGSGSRIASHVVIPGYTKMGSNNHIFQFASVGEVPQDKKFENEETFLEIGDNNIIRENATIHRGTTQGGNFTRIGNNNLLMAYTHVAHDCIVGNNIIMSNNAGLAGHVLLEDNAILGAYSGVHQFCRVGPHCFISAGSKVTQDVVPYVIIHGFENVRTTGINSVGLKRHGFSEEDILAIKRAYKIIFRQSLSMDEAIEQLNTLVPECDKIQKMIEALERAERGIVR